MLKNSQIQNGLKHASYKDYRRYCTRKIKKMRQNINLKYGKKKKVSKTMDIPVLNKLECFWIPLYHSEKFWANAMELKQASSNSDKVRLFVQMLDRSNTLEEYEYLLARKIGLNLT